MGLFAKVFGSSGPKRVEVSPSGDSFIVPSGQTILEAALDQGLAYPHDCTVGTCGSCKSLLTEGRVRALNDFGYTLSSDELAAGYILACQALPKDEITRVTVAATDAAAFAAEKFRAELVETQELTHDILRVKMQLDRPLHYVAGQYANLWLPEAQSRRRSYSFAERPLREGRDTATFFIRKVPGGVFTEALFAGRMLKQPFDIEAPQGQFHIRQGGGPMLCIAGGSGLAPLLSLLEDARKNRINRPCVFLFGARSQADLYCLDDVKAIAAGWPNRFDFIPVLSEADGDAAWDGQRGMVTEHISATLGDTDWAKVQGYMCGPPPMIDAGIHALLELGVPLTEIYYDKFTDESHGAAA